MQKEKILKKIAEGWDLIPEFLQKKIYTISVNSDDIVFQAEYGGDVNLNLTKSFQHSDRGLFREYKLSENTNITIYSEK